MKKYIIFPIIFIIGLLLLLPCSTAYAAETVSEDISGDEVYLWDDSTGTLYIKKDILRDEGDEKPWTIDDSSIKNIVIEEDVSMIEYLFEDVELDKLIIYSDDICVWSCFKNNVKIKEIDYRGLTDNLFIDEHTYLNGGYDSNVYFGSDIPSNYSVYNDSYPEPKIYSKFRGRSEYYVKPTAGVDGWFKWRDLLGDNYLKVPNQTKSNANYLAWTFLRDFDTSIHTSGNVALDANIIYGLNANINNSKSIVAGSNINPSDLDINVLALGSGYQDTNLGSYWDYNTNTWKWVGEDTTATIQDAECTVKRMIGDYYKVDDTLYPANATFAYNEEDKCFKLYVDYKKNYIDYYVGRINNGIIQCTCDGVTWEDTEYTDVTKALKNTTYSINGKALPICVIDNTWQKVNDMYCSEMIYVENGSIIHEQISDAKPLPDTPTSLRAETYWKYKLDSTTVDGTKYYYNKTENLFFKYVTTNGVNGSGESYVSECYVHSPSHGGTYLWFGEFRDGVIWFTTNGTDWYETDYTDVDTAFKNDESGRFEDNNGTARPILVFDGDYYISSSKNILYDYVTVDSNNDTLLHTKEGTTMAEVDYYVSQCTEIDGMYYPWSDRIYNADKDMFMSVNYPEANGNIYSRYTNTGYEYTTDGITWEKLWYLRNLSNPDASDVVEGKSHNCDLIHKNGIGVIIDGKQYEKCYKVYSGGIYNVPCGDYRKRTLPILSTKEDYVIDIGNSYEENNMYYLYSDSTLSGIDNNNYVYKIDDEGYYWVLKWDSNNTMQSWEKTDITDETIFVSSYPGYTKDVTGLKERYYGSGQYVYFNTVLFYDNEDCTWYKYNQIEDEYTELPRYYTIFTNEAYLPIECSELTTATWNNKVWNKSDELLVKTGRNVLVLEYNGLIYEFVVDGLTGSVGTIDFEADINSWFEVKVPNEHNIEKIETQISVPLKGDLKGNQSMVLSCTPSTTLTDGVTVINAMFSLGKTKYTYSELLQSPDAKVNVIVDKLPAGRYVGQMQLTVGIENDA